MPIMEDVEIEEQKPEAKQITISYSQYSMWLKCPNQWKLGYVDKLRPREESIHFAFGKAIHTVLQEYLQRLYEKGAIDAETINCMELFNETYNKMVVKIPEITADTIEEFRMDGKAILEYFTLRSNRQKHFPSKQYEFLGVELPLIIPLKNGKVTYKGYIDIALKDKTTGKIHIFDFKTSTMGWNKWQKADRTKLDQLVLYKRFYHMLYKTPLSNIEVEFIILKRRLMEDAAFPQQRIQRLVPPTGMMSTKEVEKSFLDFVKNGFDDDGNYNVNGHFEKTPGNNKKNCKYCPFKDMLNPDGKKYCDGKEG